MKKAYYFIILGIFFIFNSCNLFNKQEEVPTGFQKSNIENIYDLVYGGNGNNDDELASGMVADNSGNVYVSMNVTNAQAVKNIIVIKVDPSGALVWGKQYNTGGNDWSPDSGENGETGGTAGSIDIDDDGNIYIIGTSKSSTVGDAITIIKINASTGDILWQKNWKPTWPTGSPTASQDAEGYALDLEGNYAFFTGTCGTNQIVVGALNISDGSLYFSYGLDIVAGTKDRGYAIKGDVNGNIYLAGISGSTCIFAKINHAKCTGPTLIWVKNAGLDYAARINNLAIDATGLYFSNDIRGVTTRFEIMKTDFDGNILWGKSFPGSKDDRNNTHVVYISGDYVYAGGRIGEEGMDKMGDALLVKLSKTDGSLSWAGIYTTGNATNESDDQRIKGIAIINNNIYIAGQIYPNDENIEHYYGTWYENGDLALTDATKSFTDITTASLSDFSNAEVKDASGTLSDYSVGTLQNSKDKKAINAPDADAFIIKFKL